MWDRTATQLEVIEPGRNELSLLLKDLAAVVAASYRRIAGGAREERFSVRSDGARTRSSDVEAVELETAVASNDFAETAVWKIRRKWQSGQ